MNEKLAKNSPKLANMFICECCDYTCSKKSEWIRHTATSKHINATQCYIKATENKSFKINQNK